MGDLLLWGCGFGIIMKSFLRNPREWRYRLTVRTEPSQGLNRGSIPLSATNQFTARANTWLVPTTPPSLSSKTHRA